MKFSQPTITDSKGNIYQLVEFSNHDLQQYMFALVLLGEGGI